MEYPGFSSNNFRSVDMRDLILVLNDFSYGELKFFIDYSLFSAKISGILSKKLNLNDGGKNYIKGLMIGFGYIFLSKFLDINDFLILFENKDTQEAALFISHVFYTSIMKMESLENESEILYILKENNLNKSYFELETINILTVSHELSKMYVFDKYLKREAYEKTLENIIDYTRKFNIDNEVKIALLDIFRDPWEMSIIFSDDPYPELFIDREIALLRGEELMNAMKLLTFLVDYRSRFTRKHSFRVSNIARDIGKEILGEYEGFKLMISGLLHDIGKIYVPLKILEKPGFFNDFERKIMNTHSVRTYLMLKKINGLNEFAEVSLLHHEKLDGSGYPHRYKSNEIPMEVRILTFADILSALTEERPYKNPYTIKEAMSILYQETKEGKLDTIVYKKVDNMVKNGYRIIDEDIIESLLKEEKYNIIKEKINILKEKIY
ncbi:HD-GYP domain-containing protein [Marinitoga piezophila KA3]|uniref:HD-GYP domain-containing protein n=1 Tax=Marinitoga piezophila (strain DSM 14283 / JCM 11233 / KA3) TaxID=443254 RepID=H2J6Y3_MARPK|nr:HD domain-containing phosphohydrolase [Marinitoga piezophila]AEX85248.1 HD-GYP domain-containing protein [Marinitoga piezophila KA3]